MLRVDLKIATIVTCQVLLVLTMLLAKHSSGKEPLTEFVLEPAAFTATGQDGSIYLEWDASAEQLYGSEFEGYTVSMSGSGMYGPWVRIANFDKVNDLDTLWQWVLNQDTGEIEYIPVRFGTNNGLSYSLTVSQDYYCHLPILNGNTYSFKLEAYAYIRGPDLVYTSEITTSARAIGPYSEPMNMKKWAAAQGGNDHWYGLLPVQLTWNEAVAEAPNWDYALSRGYLATITSPEENQFIVDSVIGDLISPSRGYLYWIGGERLQGEWHWITDEPFVYQDPLTLPDPGGFAPSDTGLVVVSDSTVYFPAKEWRIQGKSARWHWAVIEFGWPSQSDADSKGDLGLPESFSLNQNYPNPFNPNTTIEFSLPAASQVLLTVHNVLGQTVRTLIDEYRTAGEHSIEWDGLDDKGRELASGAYLYRVTTDQGSIARKMILLK